MVALERRPCLAHTGIGAVEGMAGKPQLVRIGVKCCDEAVAGDVGLDPVAAHGRMPLVRVARFAMQRHQLGRGQELQRTACGSDALAQGKEVGSLHGMALTLPRGPHCSGWGEGVPPKSRRCTKGNTDGIAPLDVTLVSIYS